MGEGGVSPVGKQSNSEKTQFCKNPKIGKFWQFFKKVTFQQNSTKVLANDLPLRERSSLNKSRFEFTLSHKKYSTRS